MNVELENYIEALVEGYAHANLAGIQQIVKEHEEEVLKSRLKTMINCAIDSVIIEIRSELIKHLERELHVFGEDM